MRTNILLLSIMLICACLTGCTRIVRMEPASGPPGTPVQVTCSGMFGDPALQSLKWDGKVLTKHFPGSFVVPAVNQGGKPGKHTVTIVDDLDGTEAFMMFPLFRLRHANATFTVTSP